MVLLARLKAARVAAARCGGEVHELKGVRIGGWLLLAGGLVGAYAQCFVKMASRWFPAWGHTHLSLYDRLMEGESYYTHGPLVPIVSLVIALLLIRHTRIPVRPRRAAGLAALVGSLLLHLAGSLARVNFVSGFSLIGVLLGLVMYHWGSAALRRLWFPIAMLAFMVPLPEVSIAQMNFRLKMLAADGAVRIVNMLGVVAEREGNRTFLDGGKSLVVGNVCNGLRTLISLLAFGSLYAYVCRLGGLWRAALQAMSVPVAVASNSIRIVSLILVAHFLSVEAAVGWYHDASGLLIYVFAFLLMFALERGVLWARSALGRPARVAPLFHDCRRTEEDAAQWSVLSRRLGEPAAWAAGGVLALAAGGTCWLNRSVPVRLDQCLAAGILPQEIRIEGNRYSSYDFRLDERTLTILETRDYILRRYVQADGPAVDFCVIFSKDNRKSTHPPDLCLEGGGQDIIAKGDVDVQRTDGGAALPCRELLAQSAVETTYFLYTYKCGRTYTRSYWRQQSAVFVNGLLGRNATGALIRVSAQVKAGDVDQARRRATALLGQTAGHLDQVLP